MHQLIRAASSPTDLIRKIYPQYGYRESDVIIASFPKSGRNWVRHLLANSIVVAEGLDIDIHFKNDSDWISTTEPKKPPVGSGFPRIVADHDEYHGQNTQTIYIIRHPADVMESYYVYQRDRWNRSVGEFSEFIRDSKWGIPAWRSHVLSWENNIDILIKFEEMKKDSGDCLREMYSLFDKTVNKKTVEKAAERSSFDNMARMEEKYGLPEKDGANDDFSFMRKGSVEKGKQYFNQKDYNYLSQIAGDVMERYDYDIPVQSVD